jgi:cysteine synthase A
MAKRLAAEEGIITGISGGSTFKIALDIAAEAAPGSNILCMLPDTAERYMTSPLFDDIEEDMDSEEAAISTSTPGFHMGTEPETAA